VLSRHTVLYPYSTKMSTILREIQNLIHVHLMYQLYTS